MALDTMTHRFEIELGPVAGARHNLSGFVEFNTDGEMSYEFDEISKPISPDAMDHFGEFMSLMKKFHDAHGGIVKIELIKDADPPPPVE